MFPHGEIYERHALHIGQLERIIQQLPKWGKVETWPGPACRWYCFLTLPENGRGRRSWRKLQQQMGVVYRIICQNPLFHLHQEKRKTGPGNVEVVKYRYVEKDACSPKEGGFSGMRKKAVSSEWVHGRFYTTKRDVIQRNQTKEARLSVKSWEEAVYPGVIHTGRSRFFNWY